MRSNLSPLAKPIRILTVDDHPLLRAGIAATLADEPDLSVIAEATNGREALEKFRLHHPDVTLMDLQMPEIGGIDAILAIRNEFPKARIVVLTTYRGDVNAVRAIKAGAVGYLLKDKIGNELPATIRAVHAGHRSIPPEIAVEIAAHVAEDDLSSREVEVLRHVASGLANKEIADRLNLSEDTVKSHMRHIMEKLGARDRTHAVTIAVRRGIIGL